MSTPDMNAVLAALVQKVHEDCGGDWEQGREWLVSAANEIWPRTIEDQAREFWMRPRQRFGELPDNLRVAVLAQADATTEGYNTCIGAPWSSSLINKGNHTYKYHIAVAVPMALAHSMFRHISIEAADQFLTDWKFGRRDYRGCPCQSFIYVVGSLAQKFGLACSECNKVICPSFCEPLGVSDSCYIECSPSGSRDPNWPHLWSSGLCPTCWERKRTLALSKATRQSRAVI